MISCTATQDGTWNTSEFSQNVACYYGRPIVTNTSDLVNGNTTSIMHLVATPGADGISLRDFGGGNDVGHVEIAVGRRRRPDADRFVGEADMHRIGIGG